jgi:hypothetical protein
MKRRIFNALSALSAVLCLAVIAVWVLSCFRVDPVVVGRYAVADDGWQQDEWTIWVSGGVLDQDAVPQSDTRAVLYLRLRSAGQRGAVSGVRHAHPGSDGKQRREGMTCRRGEAFNQVRSSSHEA